MNYLTNLLGPNAPLAATFIVAFAVVLVLIGLTAWIFRLIRGRGLGIGSGGRGRQPRLAVLDYADVDQRRKLVLIRRDNVEHLLLLGGPTDVVVETAIVRGVPVQASVLREAAQAPEPPPAPAPDPTSRLSMRDTARQAAGEPAAARPVNLDPPPRPEPVRSPPPPPVSRPAPPARPEPARVEPTRVEPVRAEPPRTNPVVTPARPVAPPSPPVARPAPPTPAPAQPDDVAARLEAALRKPITPSAPPAAVRPGEPRPPVAPAPAPPRAPAAAPAKTLSADEKSVFDSLEEEMAALLGRGPTPPKG
ncbi:MAG: flagellar biosynthetic protein FliO [Phreatobacter sp.]|uniref:flagellar biosynthetic protein FliO n=1 Tax=Phreatobacter sp. TaxID=1966341 RepID=UPI001A5D87EB|nr:flagellar biosynthetic protein FliO [Phreatobacter sp.]MBL8570063.1 flagellar biosynthetic protein FliO [Phreatobacter sp.]